MHLVQKLPYPVLHPDTAARYRQERHLYLYPDQNTGYNLLRDFEISDSDFEMAE